MKRISLFLIIGLVMQSCLFAEDKDLRNEKRKFPDSFEIICSLSGGMTRVEYNKPQFVYAVTIQKKPVPNDFIVDQSLGSFVEVQYKTWLSEIQEEKLKLWVDKYKIKSIQDIPAPKKEYIEASDVGSADELMVYIDSKEYKLNDYTIEKNPQLSEAFDELLKMARDFTVRDME